MCSSEGLSVEASNWDVAYQFYILIETSGDLYIIMCKTAEQSSKYFGIKHCYNHNSLHTWLDVR